MQSIAKLKIQESTLHGKHQKSYTSDHSISQFSLYVELIEVQFSANFQFEVESFPSKSFEEISSPPQETFVCICTLLDLRRGLQFSYCGRADPPQYA
uniref:Uncharacterized protein n=1 Tax=Oryza brachyantha TaxID=4533 RepID=J3MJB0_ORYBR